MEGICVTGAGVPSAVFDLAAVRGPVSDVDFQQSRYFQWPPHCVADSFGSRFDPFLRVPPGRSRCTPVRADHDSYSAFGARELATEAASRTSSSPRILDASSSSASPPITCQGLADLVRGGGTSGTPAATSSTPTPTQEKKKGERRPISHRVRSSSPRDRGIRRARVVFRLRPRDGFRAGEARLAGAGWHRRRRARGRLFSSCAGTCDRDADCDPDPTTGGR